MLFISKALVILANHSIAVRICSLGSPNWGSKATTIKSSNITENLKISEPNSPVQPHRPAQSALQMVLRQETDERFGGSRRAAGRTEEHAPGWTRYEYDPILKRTVEVTPSGERFPVTLVDGKLQRDFRKDR
jgi:hypothetical protein